MLDSIVNTVLAVRRHTSASLLLTVVVFAEEYLEYQPLS